MRVRFSARFLACAIETAVNAARAAILGKSFSKVFSGPVKSHGEIIVRYAHRCSDLVWLLSFQIHFFQQLPILLRHQRQEALKAFAQLPLFFLAGSFRNFFFKAIQRAAACPLFPINIDNRSSKNSIKPRDRFLVRFRMPIGSERFDQALLNDILRQVVIAQAFSGKRHEYLKILQNCIFNTRHRGNSSVLSHPVEISLRMAISAPPPPMARTLAFNAQAIYSKRSFQSSISLRQRLRSPMAWRPEQVLALAPDASSASAGKSLGFPHKWKTLGAAENCAWGTIQGSGKKPYQTCIDLTAPAFKCTCPSRKFPCKHGLGLFLVLAQQPSSMPEKEPPAWAAEWLSKRVEKEERKDSSAERPVDPEAQAKSEAAAGKRAASRESNVTSGLDELGIFLSDLVRNGFAALPSKPERFWETPAARLVDAQAPGLARRIRSLYGISTRGEQWPADLLRELSLLHLIRAGWSRLGSLPEPTQADIRNAIGFNVNQDALLSSSGVRDSWIVAGQRVLGDDERLRTQRTWLFGQNSRQSALCLSFSAGPNQPFDISLVPGTIIDAEIVFFPSAFPLRALMKNREGVPRPAPPTLPHRGITEAVACAASAFSANPWIERIPFGLSAVSPYKNGSWMVADAAGGLLKLDAADDLGWKLMALSGGHPISLAGEWDGSCLYPLSVWAEGRFLRCDR
jgi:hypothetical protein